MSVPQSPTLRNIYAALALIASAAALQAVIWPRWPRIAPLPAATIETALRQAGWPTTLKTSRPARRGYEISSSAVLSGRLNDGGERLSLVAASVRQRESFQLAFISRDLPGLALKHRQLQVGPPAGASGRLPGGLARQSCLVPGLVGSAGFAASEADLTDAADQLSRQGDRNAQLRRLAGLAPHRRLDCVLISLQAAPGRPLPAEDRWRKLLATLQPALQPVLQPALQPQGSSTRPLLQSTVLAAPAPQARQALNAPASEHAGP